LAGHFFGSRLVRKAHFLSDEQNTRWEIDMAVVVGGGAPESQSQMEFTGTWPASGVCGDRRRAAEHYLGAGVDPRTGQANVYTSQPQSSTTAPPGEIRTVDCVDCHNRPSHILPSPDQSVDAALADGRLDASLPFIKQQGVAALTASYGDREQALRGIDGALRGFYQKTYPQAYAASSRLSRPPSFACRTFTIGISFRR